MSKDAPVTAVSIDGSAPFSSVDGERAESVFTDHVSSLLLYDADSFELYDQQALTGFRNCERVSALKCLSVRTEFPREYGDMWSPLVVLQSAVDHSVDLRNRVGTHDYKEQVAAHRKLCHSHGSKLETAPLIVVGTTILDKGMHTNSRGRLLVFDIERVSRLLWHRSRAILASRGANMDLLPQAPGLASRLAAAVRRTERAKGIAPAIAVADSSADSSGPAERQGPSPTVSGTKRAAAGPASNVADRRQPLAHGVSSIDNPASVEVRFRLLAQLLQPHGVSAVGSVENGLVCCFTHSVVNVFRLVEASQLQKCSFLDVGPYVTSATSYRNLIAYTEWFSYPQGAPRLLHFSPQGDRLAQIAQDFGVTNPLHMGRDVVPALRAVEFLVEPGLVLPERSRDLAALPGDVVHVQPVTADAYGNLFVHRDLLTDQFGRRAPDGAIIPPPEVPRHRLDHLKLVAAARIPERPSCLVRVQVPRAVPSAGRAQALFVAAPATQMDSYAIVAATDSASLLSLRGIPSGPGELFSRLLLLLAVLVPPAGSFDGAPFHAPLSCGLAPSRWCVPSGMQGNLVLTPGVPSDGETAVADVPPLPMLHTEHLGAFLRLSSHMQRRVAFELKVRRGALLAALHALTLASGVGVSDLLGSL
jgi:hypothetical protein